MPRLLWQLYTGKCPPALHASLVPCAQLRSIRFPPFVFLLLHRLVTCRPFSVKLSPSGTGCLLLSSLVRISLLFGQRFDATLSRICSALVSLSSFLVVRGPIPKSRSEKAVWSHEREQRFLYINVKIRPSLVRLRRSY